MPFDAHVLEVLIASPTDTAEYRDQVEKSLHSWNGSRAKREEVILLPRRYEMDAVPRMGEGDGQEVINLQLGNADIVIAIFHSKLGQATRRAVSGTVEEIERAISAGKHVHVYFSQAPVSRDSLRSAAEVDEFRKSLESRGLYGTFLDAAELGLKVGRDVEADLEKLNLAVPTGRKTVAGADPVATFTYEIQPKVEKSGRIRSQKKGHRIVVTNHGDTAAENLAFTLEALDGDDLPIMREQHITPTIPGNGDFSWSVMPYGGSSNSVRVDMTWTEDGKEQTKTQSLSLT